MNNSEVEFRGLRKDGGGWVYGYFGIKGKDTELESHVIMVSTLTHYSLGERFYFEEIEVIPKTVGQLALVKNGQKYFVGDVLTPISEQYKYEIVLNDGEFGLRINSGYWGSIKRYFEVCEKFNIAPIVIVNIHENKELV